MSFYVVNIEWGFLINIVVYPVAEQEVAMCSPSHVRRIVRVGVHVIVLRHLYVITFVLVATIFLIERVRSILHVSGYENLSSVSCHYDAHAAFFRFGYYVKFLMLLYVFASYFRMTAVWHEEGVVEATEYGECRL